MGSFGALGRVRNVARPDPPVNEGAAESLARAADDQAAADLARDGYRTREMAALEPDAPIAPLLVLDERVVALRRAALLDRREPQPGKDAPTGLLGDLYLTSRRLVLVGRRHLSFDLDDIEEVLLSGERLMLVMRDGHGVSLHVEQPRLMRVEIATARAIARR